MRLLSTKVLLINYLIIHHILDMIGLRETWPNIFLPLTEASPPDTNAHVTWATRQGGGVALISKFNFNLTSKLDIKFNSFEALVLKPSASTMN